MTTRHHDVTTPDGRVLRVAEAGAPDGPCLVAHHGTPGSAYFFGAEASSADALGVRLLAYDRPGYGGSTAAPGRTIADAATDVATILDALGVDTFATYGTSGGGPHALACAALLPGRCAAAATIAGAGPFDAPDLDFLAGMGEGNHVEFGKAREGREPLAAFCRDDAAGIMAAGPEQLADALRPHLSDVDAAALTGPVAEFLLASMQLGLAPGVDGWVDDDLAFIAPWGFDPGAIAVPVSVRQGDQDLMVPPEHGRWLGGHVGGAEWTLLEGEGHLTLFVHRVGDVQAWLLERLAG